MKEGGEGKGEEDEEAGWLAHTHSQATAQTLID